MSYCNEIKVNNRAKSIPALGGLYINPTRYCNLCCRHCWIAPPVKEDPGAGDGDMDMEAIIAVIRCARRLGLSQVKLTGGEPMMRKDVSEIIKYCFSKDISVIIETNGTLIDKKTASMMARYRIAHVSISLDSASEELNDSLRGRKGAYKLAMNGIRNLISEGFSPQVILSLYRENVEGFSAFMGLMKKLGIKDIKVNTISPVGRGAELLKKGIAPSVEEILAFAPEVEAARRSFKGSIYLDVPMAFKSIHEIKMAGCKKCPVKNILGILSDGTISLCGIGYVDKRVLFGNVNKEPSLLKKIWEEDPFLRDMREGLPSRLKGICGMCVFKASCLGSCRAEVYYNTGDLFAPYWFCAEAHEKGLFPRTRLLPEELRLARNA